MKKQEAYHLVLYRGKPHGFKGHIKFQLAEELLDEFDEVEHLFVNNNGTYLPYFVEEISFPNDRYCIIKLEDIHDANAKINELYIHAKDKANYIQEDQEETIYNGFTCEDIHLGPIGIFIRLEQLPAQEIAILSYHEKELMIPFVDELIAEIDEENKKIIFNLPDGFLEIYD